MKHIAARVPCFFSAGVDRVWVSLTPLGVEWLRGKYRHVLLKDTERGLEALFGAGWTEGEPVVFSVHELPARYLWPVYFLPGYNPDLPR
jgi:hypothetical protein